MLFLLAGASGTVSAQAVDEAVERVSSWQLVWSKAHAAAQSASQGPEACTPKFAALVRDAREAAGRWVKASAQAFDAWVAQQASRDASVPALEAAGEGEINAFLALLDVEKAVFERKKASLSGNLVLERAAEAAAEARERADFNLRPALQGAASTMASLPSSAGKPPGAAAAYRRFQGARTEELSRFRALYDAMESDVKQRCSQRRPAQPSDPFVVPKKQ